MRQRHAHKEVCLGIVGPSLEPACGGGFQACRISRFAHGRVGDARCSVLRLRALVDIMLCMAIGELSHYVRVYDNDLEPQLCERMLASFAALARFQVVNGRGVRGGLEQSAWTELNV